LNVFFAVKSANVTFVVRFSGRTAVKRMKLRKINSVQKTTGSRRIAV